MRGPRPKSISERFWSKVQRTDSCWLWTGGTNGVNGRRGYGQLGIQTKEGKQTKVAAHRLSYKMFVGEIPHGKEIDHLCNNTICVNPKHLRIVSHKENLRRSDLVISTANSKKTRCKFGHHFDHKNTYVPARLPNSRYCRACDAARKRRRRRADF